MADATNAKLAVAVEGSGGHEARPFVGASVDLPALIRNRRTSALVDAATLVCVVKKPGGTSSTYTLGGSPAVTQDQAGSPPANVTGTYRATHVVTEAGIHRVTWTATIAGSLVGVGVTSFVGVTPP